VAREPAHLLADDHEVVRLGPAHVAGERHRLEGGGEAPNGRDAVEKIAS
jgi:hypothetical protein